MHKRCKGPSLVQLQNLGEEQATAAALAAWHTSGRVNAPGNGTNPTELTSVPVVLIRPERDLQVMTPFYTDILSGLSNL